MTKTLACRAWAMRAAVRPGPQEATLSVPCGQDHEHRDAPCGVGDYHKLPSQVQRVAQPAVRPWTRGANAWDDQLRG